jgi:hypothetical protein
MFSFKRKTKTAATTPANVTHVAQTLDAAKDQLLGLDADAFLREQSLQFAHSLLAAVGENPETPQNQLLVHQMAIENLRARAAIVNAPARK